MDEEKFVGYITEVEDTSGEMINTNKIDGDKRKEWIEHLKQKIESIDGVEGAYIGGFEHQNHQLVDGEIILNTDSGFPNLRRVSQILRRTIMNESYVSSYELIESPRKQEGGGYDRDFYTINFAFV